MSLVSTALARIRIDPYVVAIVVTAGLAAIVPARAAVASGLDDTMSVAIGVLFFIYGARLSTREAVDGVRNWRLHLLILLISFVLFPALGAACQVLVPTALSPELYLGLVFMCALPTTVQSSITFSSLSGGNVAAAICSASFCNMLGVVLTPLLVGLLAATGGSALNADSIRDIVLLLLVPFLVGQLMRPAVGAWVRKHRRRLGLLDRGVILLAVFVAFSEGTVSGVWGELTPGRIGVVVVVDAVLLAAGIAAAVFFARRMGFPQEDKAPIVFCASQKSLTTGLPMATVIFGGQSVGLVVLPLMLYHQLQLIVGAWLARKFAAEQASTSSPGIPQPRPEMQSSQRNPVVEGQNDHANRA